MNDKIIIPLEELLWMNIAVDASKESLQIRSVRKSTMEHPGCYILRHQRSDKLYVGSSARVYKRVSNHRTCLKNPQASVVELCDLCLLDKGFFFDVAFIATSTKNEALDYEQSYIDFYRDSGRLLNRAMNARLAGLGRIVGEELRGKISRALTGKSLSTATREKLSKIRKNRPKSEHHKSLLRLNQPRAIALSIEREIYPSYAAAARTLGLDRSLVQMRVKSVSARFAEWKILEQ